MHRKIVFICSPFAGDVAGNIDRARRYGRFAVTKNTIPVIPHLMGNNNKSHMENTVVRIVDLQKEIKEDVERSIAIKAEIMDTISQVDDPIGQIILEMRYVNGKGWDEIARDIRFDIRTAFRVHGKALKQIEEIKNRQRMSVFVSECQ